MSKQNGKKTRRCQRKNAVRAQLKNLCEKAMRIKIRRPRRVQHR